jgi:hypothetical protein
MSDDQDLKAELARQPSVDEMLEAAWQSSAKNLAAISYMAGMLDGLRYLHAISLDTYAHGYRRYVDNAR